MQGVLSPESISAFVAVKSTGTLTTRASAWNLFFRYAREKGLEPSSLNEPAAFVHLAHLKEVKAAPLWTASFLAACHFVFGCAGFKHGPSIATSARCTGAAAMSLSEKRERLQRDPLQAPWLKIAEH